MSAPVDLAERLASVIQQRATNAQMPSLGANAGLTIPPYEEGVSKRDRAREALAGKTPQELGEIARRLGAHLGDYDLEETGLAVQESGSAQITEITRRDVAKCFGDDLCGEQDLVALVGRLFPIQSLTAEFFSGRSLAQEIQQHMVRNTGDWDVEYLFQEIGALSCSRDRFGRLLEAALHPLGRRGQEQFDLVEALNRVLRRDGYILEIEAEESGYPIYRLQSLSRGPAGSPKNLIFASNGPKPEIGFADAINNDIVILSNASSCLVYDRPFKRDGLLWSELVDWWRATPGVASDDAARTLGLRLRASLASDAERNLFDTYFRLYRAKLRDALPAIIPQVYLHYDPAVVKLLRHRAGLSRQRMDFLLLLPNNQRVVIEVDGSQHFSLEGAPSLAAYAEMVSADRELRLAGYEIYRFGSNELVGAGASELIERFFERLWTLHKINPTTG
ncbi:MAG: AbiJ-related protein [Methylovirgula sp.]